MQLNKQDRNTALIIAVVLVVCTASLIAVGSTLLNLIAPGVRHLANILGVTVRTVTVDYNFAVPKPSEASQTPSLIPNPETSASSSTNSAAINANFNVPNTRQLPPHLQNTINQRVGIEQDAKKFGFALMPRDENQVSFHITIPKLNFFSPVFKGNNGLKAVAYGMWQFPTSHSLGNGETIVVCERSWFNQNDSRSCLFLHELTIGDEATITQGDYTRAYKVTNVSVLPTSLESVYMAAADTAQVRIVTNNPAGKNSERLIVILEPATE
jgi:LPXTG-site transpeptidase (sortase) family protein